MAELDDIREKIKATLAKLSLGQKLSIGVTLLIITIVFAMLFKWATKPDYGLLFSNVEMKEAGSIIDALNAENVPYKTTAGGTAILIPSQLIYEWRIKLSSSGAISSGSIGYEVFDNNELGISDFKQKVNLKRALEGELQRTIESFDGVKRARVHIVMPKDRLFREDQNPATASVQLEMSGSRLLREQEVMGIAILIAGSVEGLTQDNVRIIDNKMRVLSNQYPQDSVIGLSSGQHDLQRQVEAHLVRNAQSMLSTVLGENRTIVRVAADLDFDRIQSTKESYDPETAAILAEQRNEQSDSKAGQQTGTAETSTTNYEVPRTIEHITNSVGNIRRLSVAVLIDDKRLVQTAADGTEEVVYTRRTAEELQRFENIVKNAVGFNDVDRGDQFKIENIHFDTMDDLDISKEVNQYASLDFWLPIGRKLLPVLLLIIFVGMIRSQLRRVKVSMPGKPGSPVAGAAMAGVGGGVRGPTATGGAGGAEATILPKIEDGEVSPEAEESAKLLQQISSFVQDKPMQALKLLRYWILEE